jgi:hypothetical protein
MTYTEPPPTQVDDIVVRGQRRRPGGSFPAVPGGGGGDPGGSDGIDQDELDPNEPPPPPSPPHACDDPATAVDWNADAAAAEAAKAFARLAAARDPAENLDTREWGAYLYRMADGSVRVGPVSFGNPFGMGGVGGVDLIEDGPRGDIIGSVHSHNAGNHLPSTGPGGGGDIGHLDGMVDTVRAAGGDFASVRMYIVARAFGPPGSDTYNRISVYTPATARTARETSTPGPEVNPEGQPCSAH